MGQLFSSVERARKARRATRANKAEGSNQEQQPSHGHNYNGLVASDNARIHAGDTYAIYHQYYTAREYYYAAPGHGLVPELVGPKRRIPPDSHIRRGGGHHFLTMSMDVLCGLSKTISHQIYEGETLGRVQRSIGALIHALEDGTHGEAGNKEWDIKLLTQDLRVSSRVDVNGMHTNISVPPRVATSTRRRATVTIHTRQISLDVVSWTKLDASGLHTEESLSSLRVRPLDGCSGTPLTVSFRSKICLASSTVHHPSIIAYHSVKRTSEAFEMVRRDDLGGLLRLLALGKATLRDCDEENYTLLYVSLVPRPWQSCWRVTLSSMPAIM